MAALTPELVLDVRAELGEGPIWDAALRRLLFVDIHQRRLHSFDPITGDHRVFQLERAVSAITPTKAGDWLAAADLGFVRIDPATGDITSLPDVEPARSRRRMNDGAVDPAGRFWAGSMSLDGVAGQGTLFRVDRDLVVTPMVTPVTTSNGPAWSPDGRLMYYADTRTRRVDVFDFAAEAGTVANRRPFVSFESGPGRPDGVIVDRSGGVWVALWEGSAVQRYFPDGRLDLEITLPVRCPTKCAFGGADLGDLYITSARAPLDPELRATDRPDGGLFAVRPGVFGQILPVFG
jgi:sugar lactone lactonase YvrE